MATKKKSTKKKNKMPSVPGVQQAPISQVEVPFQPYSTADYIKDLPSLVRAQLALEPEITAGQIKKQEALSASELGLNQQYMPQYQQLYQTQLQAANPQFMPNYNALGASVREQLKQAEYGGSALQQMIAQNVTADLAAGRELGAPLSREVQQAIRGAQTARGNILGAAPTAEEAFTSGQAAEQLYGQRLGRAQEYEQYAQNLISTRQGAMQNFLQGRQPTDLYGSLQTLRPNLSYPSQNYIGQSAGMIQNVTQSQSAFNAASVDAQSNYNNALLQNASMQNQYAFEGYDRSLDQWMYKEAVKQGLYSTPSYGGGGMGGGMGGIGSSLISGIGGGVTAGIGLAAAGAGAGTALAGGAAAAISAAGAAICWLARRCIPDHWRQWRKWLFTKASDEMRIWYIYNAKRLASKLDDTSADVLGRRMLKLVT
jgi:hypothetical protein